MFDKWSNGKPKRGTLNKYELNEQVRIVHLMPKQEFSGVIVSEKPLKAVITDEDKVWKGAEITSEGNIRKLRRFKERV